MFKLSTAKEKQVKVIMAGMTNQELQKEIADLEYTSRSVWLRALTLPIWTTTSSFARTRLLWVTQSSGTRLKTMAGHS